MTDTYIETLSIDKLILHPIGNKRKTTYYMIKRSKKKTNYF